MKFDYDRAWKDTTQLLGANFSLLAIIGGVFLFLPYATLLIVMPDAGGINQPEMAANQDAALAALMDFYRSYWWLMLALALVQSVGLLAMLALLKQRARPTVADALRTGLRSVLSYFGAQVIQSFLLLFVATILVSIGVLAGSNGLAVLGAILAVILAAYVLTKLSLVAPVIAIDGKLNPIAALQRSWRLTKGHSVRLVGFYLLLLLAFVVCASIFSLLATFVFALLGEEAALFGSAIVSALVSAGFMIMMAGILAAVHTQLVRLEARRAGLDEA